MASKKPSIQFYPGDWLKDPALRSVSLAARGMWIELLCRMFECDRRGYLQVNGKPASLSQIARMAGCDTDEARICLQELEDSGVFSRTPHGSDGEGGCIFSRRMVRDESNKKTWRENGKKGGNQNLTKSERFGSNLDNPNPNQNGQGGVNQKRLSSTSTSVINSPPPAHVRDGEEEGEDGETGDRNPLDPLDEVPGQVMDYFRKVYGLTCDGVIVGWLTVEKWPLDWIEKAALKVAAKGMTGNKAIAYAAGIMRDWKRNGGPENEEPKGGTKPSKRPGGSINRADSKKFDGLDEWAKQ